MTTHDCAEVRFLLQADLDGELDVGDTALLAAHLAHCPDCAAEQKAMAALSARLRGELPYHAVPARLRQAIETAMAIPAAVPSVRIAARRPWLRFSGHWLDRALPFGAGLAVAAVVALVIVAPRGDDLTASVVASHIRALQPGHLMDVVSTDQHTVKPWFDGRLDYAPPVKDLASAGFPLVGGRLDYLDGRPVAALAYHRAQHVIDLTVWPSARRIAAPSGSGERNGYNYVRWSQNEMEFWAVSDLNQAELSEFVQRWRGAP